jgi:hypothetical protein
MDRYAGKRMAHGLRLNFARQDRPKATTWTQLFKINGTVGAYKPPRNDGPRSLWQALNGRPIQSQHLFFPKRGKVSPAGKRHMPMQKSSYKTQPFVYRQLHAGGARVPVSAQEKETIRDIYRQSELECKEFAYHNDATAVAMTVTGLKEIMPRFRGYGRHDLKDLVRSCVRPRGAPISRPVQQPVQQPVTRRVPEAITGFTARWQNTAFTSNEATVELDISYDENSALGRIPKKERAPELAFFGEYVQLTMPGDVRFGSVRQYALYGQALALEKLHARRATGYRVDVAEFHSHKVPAAPHHAAHAAQAKALAQQILAAGNGDLDRIEARLKTLHGGLGWDNRIDFDGQLRIQGWLSASRQHAPMAKELRDMDAQACASHPVLQKVRRELHRDAEAKRQDQARQEGRQQLQADIDSRLGAWAREAWQHYPHDPIAANNFVQAKLYELCEQKLTGSLWLETRKEKSTDRIVDRSKTAVDHALDVAKQAQLLAMYRR